MDVDALAPDDWRRWRVLRRAALAQAPEAFCSSLAGWSGAGDTEERWRSRWAGVPHNLVVVRDGRDVGMVGLTAPVGDDDPELVSLWVAPEARGTGAADAAVEAVLALAADAYPGRAVALVVFADNLAARRLYARHGFVDAAVDPGADPGADPDGGREVRMVHSPPADAG